CARSNWDVDYW
nr:immunoglobulin heavy chain junction region [Mus musculus]